MQRIERYGVLALVFLLVTIVTFALWDDDAKPGDEVAAADTAARREAPQRERLSSTDRARAARDAANRVDGRRTTPRRQPVPVPQDDMAKRYEAERAAREAANRNRTNPASKGAAEGGFTRMQRPTVDGTQPKTYQLDLGADTEASQATPEPARTTPQPIANKTAPSNRDRIKKMDEQRRRREHVVASGESLSVIAQQHLGSSSRWREIADLNPSVDPNRLQVGERLKLPAPGAATSVAATPRPASKPTSKPAVSGPGGTYTIQSGDVLSRIAQDQLGSVKRVPDILALNPGLDPMSLSVGQVIAMPAGATTTVARARTTSGSNARRDDRPRVR